MYVCINIYNVYVYMYIPFTVDGVYVCVLTCAERNLATKKKTVRSKIAAAIVLDDIRPETAASSIGSSMDILVGIGCYPK